MSIGHETVMAKATFFSSAVNQFNFGCEFMYQKLLVDSPSSSCKSATSGDHQFALLEFEKPVVCSPLSRVVGSRLDSVAHSNMCRIAFHGTLAESITQKDYEVCILPRLKVFKSKRREGIVDRVSDCDSAFVVVDISLTH